MALSDYLTNDEWDGIFYASFGKARSTDFGTSMHIVIDKLLKSGYSFSGLYEDGSKKEQISGTDNPYKICIFLGNPHDVDVKQIYKNGRKFIKEHLPEFIGETDEEFEKLLK